MDESPAAHLPGLKHSDDTRPETTPYSKGEGSNCWHSKSFYICTVTSRFNPPPTANGDLFAFVTRTDVFPLFVFQNVTAEEDSTAANSTAKLCSCLPLGRTAEELTVKVGQPRLRLFMRVTHLGRPNGEVFRRRLCLLGCVATDAELRASWL